MGRAAEALVSAAVALAILSWTVVVEPVFASTPPEGPAPPRLVVLYATCSLSTRYLSPYQPWIRYTPSLAAFSREALTFDRHQTEAGQSGPAFASILSGVQATRHGILRHPRFLDESLQTITEAYAEAGYDVHTWLEHLMASSALGYGQGARAENVHAGGLGATDPAFLAILDRLERDPDYKAFVVTSFTVTHFPYRARDLRKFCRQFFRQCRALEDEEAFRHYRAIYGKDSLRFALDQQAIAAELGLGDVETQQMADVVELLYKASVFELDRLFGEVVQEIDGRGLGPVSLIAFTADHGEILYRDDALLVWTHGFQLAPEVLAVPWLLRGPNVAPGRYREVTRSIDVYPTMAALSGIDVRPPTGGGRDLSASVRGVSDPPRQLAFSHSALFPGPIRNYPAVQRILSDNRPPDLWVAVRDRDHVFKLRRLDGGAWEPALFDLDRDPTEQRNLFDPSNAEHRAMQRRLELYKKDLIEGTKAVKARRQRRQRARASLKQLGYIE